MLFEAGPACVVGGRERVLKETGGREVEVIQGRRQRLAGRVQARAARSCGRAQPLPLRRRPAASCQLGWGLGTAGWGRVVTSCQSSRSFMDSSLANISSMRCDWRCRVAALSAQPSAAE